MAVDPNLIRSVAKAYEYQNYVPEIKDLGLADLGKRLAKGKQMRRIKDENIQKEVKSYIDKYPPGISSNKIPEKYRSAVSAFSFKQKKIYSDAISSRVKMKAGSDEYQEQTDLMNGALQAVSNLKSQWDIFGQGKEENLGDIDSRNYSAGNSLDNLGVIASVYTDKLDASISDSGDLSFLTEDGGSFKLSDIDQPFLKAKKEAKFIQDKLVSAYESGVRLNDESANFVMKQIELTIDEGGIDSLKSLAMDNMIANVELYDGSEEIFERLNSNDDQIRVQAAQELRSELLSKYKNTLISQSQKGYSVKNPVEIKEPTSKEAFNSLASSDPEKYSLLLNNLGDENKSMLAGTELQRNLNMQALRYSGYYTEYDKETNSFMLFDKNEKQDFQDEGASYPATPQGINQLLNEVDSSRR
jgi:hypothetical protein